MKAKMLLLVPLGLALGGCATMDLGGLLGYPSTPVYQPAYTYGYPTTQQYYGGAPAQQYYGGAPYYGGVQPGVVAPRGGYYGYGATANDWDGDRVLNHMDRYPNDPRRW